MYKSLLAVFFVLISSSCLKQGKAPKIPGVTGPKVNIQDGKIVLSIGLEALDAPAGIDGLPIPKLKNSSFGVTPNLLEGGSLFKVHLDPKDLEGRQFQSVPSEVLPDGRDFPYTVDGKLPALAVNLPEAFDTTLYLSQKVFGLFLPIKLPSDYNVSLHYRLKVNGKNIGIVGLIEADENGEGSGLILMLTLKKINENKDFQKLLKHSKKKKFKKVLF